MITAIILAAGKGNRMKSEQPKQFMELLGKPIVYYSLKAFQESNIDNIILVTGEEYITYCEEEIVKCYHFDKVMRVVAGGTERYWSVRSGLDSIVSTDYVLIHDSARACITTELINKCIDEVSAGACTLGVPVKDTIKVVDSDGIGIETPNRELLWQIQTPQCFSYKELLDAYEKMQKNRVGVITDDTMILEQYLGKKSRVIRGSYNNIKITTPEDLIVAENFLKNYEKSC